MASFMMTCHARGIELHIPAAKFPDSYLIRWGIARGNPGRLTSAGTKGIRHAPGHFALS
jgi:hypothetical protein